MKSGILLLLLLAFAGRALADDPPRRKPGLWEIVTQNLKTGAAPTVQRICIDREIDEWMSSQGGSPGSRCSDRALDVSGSTVTARVVCTFGKSRLTSNSVTTFDGDTLYHSEISGRFDPPMAGMSQTASSVHAKWIGDCPAGMLAGRGVLVTPQGTEVKIDIRPTRK
jgi:hypothetical protein